MADKELVIRLDEETYDAVCKGQEFGKLYLNTLREICDAVKSATLLPKGHGDLINRNEVIKNLFDYIDGKKTIGQCIDDVQTIIEADKTGREKRIRNESRNGKSYQRRI